MIDKNILTLASEHAAQLADLGIHAAPAPSTPLAVLVGELMADSSTGELFITDDFKARVAGMADELSDHIRRYQDFARNVVQPAVEDIKAKVQEGILTINLDPFAGLSIEEVGLPSLLEDSDFMTRVTSVANNSSTIEGKVAGYGSRTNEELKDMMTTGVAAWDREVAQWLATQPEGTLQKVWNSIFVHPSKSVNAERDIDRLLSDYASGGCAALIAFLIASRQLANTDDDIDMTLNDARVFLDAVMGHSGRMIMKAIDRHNSFVATNTLVDSALGTQVLRVNKAVYKQYLASGGSADVLMGLLVTGAKHATIHAINADAENLLKEWGNYTAVNAARSEAEYDLKARTVFNEVFEASLASPYNDVEATKLNEPGVRENIMRHWKEEMQSISTMEMHTNWIDKLWRAVVRSRFYYSTFSYDLLDSIDGNVRNFGTDPASAATIATQKLINRFIAEMVVKV